MHNKNLPFEDHSEVCFVGPMMVNQKVLERFQPTQFIYIDGGIKHCPDSLVEPFLIGDGDSAPNSNHSFSTLLNKNKNFSDLSYGLSLLTKKQTKVNLVGFSKGRLDHQLAIFGECHQHLRKFAKQVINIDDAITYYPEGVTEIHLTGTFSLFSLQSTTFEITGNVDYSLNKELIPPYSSKLLSNFAKGKFTVSASAPFCLIHGDFAHDL